MKTDDLPLKKCSCCGKLLPALHDLSFRGPDEEYVTEERKREFEGSTDLKRWHRAGLPTLYYIKCVANLPIIGHSRESFGIGFWIQLSEKDCFEYRSTWQVPIPFERGTWMGKIANSLRGYPETLGLEVKALYEAEKNQRPLLEICSSNHPLALDQRKGISIETAVDFLRND